MTFGEGHSGNGAPGGRVRDASLLLSSRVNLGDDGWRRQVEGWRFKVVHGVCDAEKAQGRPRSVGRGMTEGYPIVG